MSNLCENAFFFCLTGVSLATIWGGRRVSWGGGATRGGAGRWCPEQLGGWRWYASDLGLPGISFGLLRVFSIVIPFLYVGTLISKNFAALLEEHDIFVPEDNDDDD
uniref:Essential MCU regulator, mitochondrial n=1 Tax=Bos indicus x Bos taurus TaxID=30522 RepID=A0A4W2H7H1_BOBOX